jgi:predicted glycogen debranching enzyme
MPWGEENVSQLEPLLSREWLVANGLGGYASGIVGGVVTRRYHGLLIAALAAPLGRMLTLVQLSEQIRLPGGQCVRFSGEERMDTPLAVHGAGYLAEFRLDAGLPVWRYQIEKIVLEKSVSLVHQQNTTHVTYRLLDGPASVRLKVLPSVHFRPHDAPVSTALPKDVQLHAADGRYEISAGPQLPALRMRFHGRQPAFTVEPRILTQFLYRLEGSRGYDSEGDLWSPGYFRVDLGKGEDATLVASTESWEIIEALRPDQAGSTGRARAAGTSVGRGEPLHARGHGRRTRVGRRPVHYSTRGTAGRRLRDGGRR